MSVQDNYLKTTDGYFARLSPLLDSVEEVTVTTAGNTADATGQGAVQIRFVTKSGHATTGTAPCTSIFRHDALNANTLVQQPRPAAGSGRPARRRSPSCDNIPAGLRAGRADRGRNKAFFFFNYEERAAAGQRARCSAHASHREAAAGVFSYNAGGAARSRSTCCSSRRRTASSRRSIRPSAKIARPTSRRRRPPAGGVTPLNNPLVQQYTWSDADRELQPVADRASGLRVSPGTIG